MRTGRLVIGALVVLLGLFTVPAVASAYAFHSQNARDWVQSHYNDRMYGNDYWMKSAPAWCRLRTGKAPEYRFGMRAGSTDRLSGCSQTPGGHLSPDLQATRRVG